MASTALTDYITAARGKGASDDQIKEVLLKNGWHENDINHALNPITDDAVAVPPPPAPHFGMWIGFLYVILFISLYVTATSFAGILHYAVNDYVPDALDQVTSSSSSYRYVYGGIMQGLLACLIVGFPIFAALFLFLKHQTISNPQIKGLRIRKLLIYLTLIGTFLILLGHIITTVYSFLGGTVTMRALAHLGITFLVAGGIFVYFLMDVLGDRKQT